MILSFLHSLERKGFQSVDGVVIKKVGIKKVGGILVLNSSFTLLLFSKKKIYTKESSSTGYI